MELVLLFIVVVIVFYYCHMQLTPLFSDFQHLPDHSHAFVSDCQHLPDRPPPCQWLSVRLYLLVSIKVVTLFGLVCRFERLWWETHSNSPGNQTSRTKKNNKKQLYIVCLLKISIWRLKWNLLFFSKMNLTTPYFKKCLHS